MIVLHNISVTEQNKTLLHNICLHYRRGEHSWIHGPCGSGKTTLARILAGRRRYNSGSLRYKNYWDGSVYDHIRMISFTDNSTLFRGVNANHYYQQRFNSWDADGHLTVHQYLVNGVSEDRLDANRDLLTNLGLDSLLELERIKLSSGQHRKMYIAKVLMYDPKVLILDNLYVGLDKDAVHFVNRFLDQLVKQRDINLFIFGHHRDLPVCVQRETLLSDGSIDYDGPLRKISPASVRMSTHPEHQMPYALRPSELWPETGSILDFRDVSIAYAGKFLIKDFNWVVNKGEKWVLSGKNGSGKSLIVSLIYGDNPQAHANHIRLFDKRIGPGRSIWEMKKHIGFTSPELHAYFEGQKSFESVVKTGKYDTLHLPAEKEPLGEVGLALMEYFLVAHLKERTFNSLSTGEQRLCLLIRALVKNPAMVLLDEPFQGMDPGLIRRAKTFLNKELSNEHTAILITHDPDHIPDNFNSIKSLS